MGVYIPNIKKPKQCIKELDYGLLDEPCLFIDEREACLLQNNSKIGEYEENYKTCPLIEIDLVRCGECKWGNKDNEGTLWCEHAIGGIMKPTDFCSYGERRADCEDETDEEWYDWRDEQEYEDRWERRADEHNT